MHTQMLYLVVGIIDGSKGFQLFVFSEAFMKIQMVTTYFKLYKKYKQIIRYVDK